MQSPLPAMGCCAINPSWRWKPSGAAGGNPATASSSSRIVGALAAAGAGRLPCALSLSVVLQSEESEAALKNTLWASALAFDSSSAEISPKANGDVGAAAAAAA